MSATRAILIISCCWLGASIIGAIVGWGLGLVSPGFVIGLFHIPVEPVSTGVGLGVANGGMAGLAIGVLAVLIEAFGRKRKAGRKNCEQQATPTQPSASERKRESVARASSPNVSRASCPQKQPSKEQ